MWSKIALSKYTWIMLALLSAAFFLFTMFMNNMGQTEKRAYQGAENFISTNSIVISDETGKGRVTCAGDSEPQDGYGSCAVVTAKGEKIYLQCPTDWFQVNVWNARSCKEIEAALYFRGGRG